MEKNSLLSSSVKFSFSLQERGAHNLNLVTATQFLPQILPALDAVKNRLTIPVVYNSSGYEKPETIALLKDYVDICAPGF